jgi:hypothetical protein
MAFCVPLMDLENCQRQSVIKYLIRKTKIQRKFVIIMVDVCEHISPVGFIVDKVALGQVLQVI